MTGELKHINMKSIRLSFHESLSLLCFIRDLMESPDADALLYSLQEYRDARRIVKDPSPIEGPLMNARAFNTLCDLSDNLVRWSDLEKVTNIQKSIDIDKDLVKRLSEIVKYKMEDCQRELSTLCIADSDTNTAETIQKIKEYIGKLNEKVELYIILTR